MISSHWDFASEDGPKLTGKYLSSAGDEGEFNLQIVPQGEDALTFKVGQSNIQMTRMQVQ